MNYKESGSIKTLEHNGLNININYASFIAKIDEEINNSYIYRRGEDKDDNGSLYYFGKKGVTKDNYTESLLKIKELIDKIFTDIPTFNIFEFFTYTKKGKFTKNRKINLAVPVVALFENFDYYKYVECFAVEAVVENESTANVYFRLIQSDVNKIDPIFFNDYETPIIREKLKAIKKSDLKQGMIYSDEKHKKYILYLGYAKKIPNTVFKQSKTILPTSDFTKEEMENSIDEYIEEEKKIYKKYGVNYSPYKCLYIRLTKKQYESLINAKSPLDFEDFITNCITSSSIEFYISESENAPRVFFEEHECLINVKKFKKILNINTKFINNISGPCIYTKLPKDTFTACNFTYIDFN